MPDNQQSPPSELETSENLATSEYLVNAFFDVLQTLVNRNRAYHSVLTELVSSQEIPVYLKKAEEALPSVIEPPIYADLRLKAIGAVESRNIAEFFSLAREVSNRTRAWL
jgi:hypothetical protein